MKNQQKFKTEIHGDLSDLSRIINQLTMKYEKEPLVTEARKAFMSLSVHVGRALDIDLN